MSASRTNKLEVLLEAFPNLGPESNEPSPEQLKALIELDYPGPFQFVNLLKYKTTAQYPSDHASANQQISGREAYQRYGLVALDHVTRRRGRLIFSNSVHMQVVGLEGDWDAIATMQHDTVDAFIDMVCDPDYQAALVHRDAGLENSHVFVTQPVVKRPIGRLKFLLIRIIRRLIG